jgi:hypothetical protein
MKTLRPYWLITLLVLPCLNLVAESNSTSASSDRLFDQYSVIRWEDERARLDNFAILLMDDPELVGYVFATDGQGVCRGEAQARAMRAKRYIVEHRGVPWNRVIWRSEGYTGLFLLTLQPIRRSVPINYPFLGDPRIAPEVHVMANCRSRIARIKGSKW